MIKRLLISIIFLSLISVPLTVLASDISGALYFATIQVSNNSTATTNVATTANISTTNLINGGYLNAGANNTVMRSSSGADIPFQPGYTPDGYPWCMRVPSIGDYSYLNYILYTANSTGGKIRYFPGAGGMTTDDSATLELGDNFTIEQAGWVDTSSGEGKNLVFKSSAFRTFIDGTGNITSEVLEGDNFATDTWTDVGAKIVVNVGNERLEYESERSAVDTRCYKDLTSVSDTSWTLDFTIHPTSTAGNPNNAIVGFGLWSAATNWNGYAGDAILISEDGYDDFTIHRYDGGVLDSSGSIGFTRDTTYYVTVERTTATNVTLSVYSDSGRITHVAGSPVSLTIPSTVVGLRYLAASNQDDNVGAADEVIGWIDDVSWGVAAHVTATGVESGEHTVKTASTPTLYFDGTDDFIDGGNHSSLDITDNLTIELWFYPTQTGSFRGVIFKGNTFATLSYGMDQSNSNPPTVRFHTRDAGANDIHNSASFTANAWHHIVATWDGTNKNLYIDGVPNAPRAWAGPIQPTTDTLWVSRSWDGYNSGSFGGIRIYNRTLAPTEVTEHFQGIYHDDTGLVLYYPLDEESGTVANDASGTGNDGSITSATWTGENTLKISVDGLAGSVTPAASVLDNANDWTFLRNNVMSYMESHEIEVDAVQAQYIEWEYSDNFTDQSVNNNFAIPTFRSASSDADVTANMTSFLPITEAKAPDYALGEAPAFIDADALTGTVTSTFTTTPGTGTGTFPLAGVITAIANASSTPPQLPLLIIACFIIIAASLSVSAIMREHGSGSLLVKIVAIIALMGIFVALGNFAIDFWMILIFLLIAVAIAFASKQLGWT